MSDATRKRSCAALVSVVLTGWLTGCQVLDKGPVPIATEQVKNLSRDGRLYVGGDPTPDGLKAMKDRGVKTLIDLRLKEQVPAGEFERAQKLGLTYIPLPMRSEAVSDQEARAFLEAMKHHGDAPVLIYCKSANRAAAMYGLYVGMSGNRTVSEAMKRARQAGLKNESLAKDVEKYLETHRR